MPLIVGFVDYNQATGRPFHNSAALLQRGKPVQKIHKSLLPTYDVFDEDRYFQPAANTRVFSINGEKIGPTICEDIWDQNYLPRQLYTNDPVGVLVAQGARVIVNISASPFYLGKPRLRLEMLSGVAAKNRCPVFYCNAVGGNDQLIFDGNSLAFNSRGGLIAQLAAFREEVVVVDLESMNSVEPLHMCEHEELFTALCLGLRDYLSSADSNRSSSA